MKGLSWKYKILIGFGFLILILIITNPTESDFKEYVNVTYTHNDSDTYPLTMGRISYYGIYSIYEVQKPYEDGIMRYNYVGIFKNFIPLQ